MVKGFSKSEGIILSADGLSIQNLTDFTDRVNPDTRKIPNMAVGQLSRLQTSLWNNEKNISTSSSQLCRRNTVNTPFRLDLDNFLLESLSLCVSLFNLHSACLTATTPLKFDHDVCRYMLYKRIRKWHVLVWYRSFTSLYHKVTHRAGTACSVFGSSGRVSKSILNRHSRHTQVCGTSLSPNTLQA